MALLIPLTYTLCVEQGHCPKFLPTISNTWVYPPENYISRWFVGNLCVMFAMFQAVIYYENVNTYAQTQRKSTTEWITYEALFYLSVFGIFCLSWVGAICDNDEAPSCRGNNTIHTACAVTFFTLYDFYMIMNHIKMPSKSGVVSWCLLAANIMLYPRIFLKFTQLGMAADTPLAILEWTDVALIVAWTIHYPYQNSLTFEITWGAVAGPAEDVKSSQSIFAYFNCRSMTKLVNGLYTFVLLGSLIAAVVKGSVPMDHVPYISDLWVYPPGNWFSRWGVVQATHWLYWVQGFLFYSAITQRSGPARATVTDHSLWILSEVAVFALSIVGVCNEDENLTIHLAAAYTFFGCYDLYMLATGLRCLCRGHNAKDLGEQGRRCLPMVLACVALAAQAGRYGLTTEDVGENVLPILEWTNAIIMIIFVNYDVFSRSTTEETFVALVDTGVGKADDTEAAHRLKMQLLEGGR